MATEAALRKERELRTRYLLEAKDAYRAWQANNPDEARILLDLHVPADRGVPDLREVEWYYLDYVLSTTRRELDFGGEAHTARFSPDGKWLAAAGIADTDGYCIQLWEVPKFRHERTLVLGPKGTTTGSSWTTSPPAGLENMAFSPDGSLLAATCTLHKENRIDGFVKAWESDTGRQVFSASDGGIGGRAIVFSPDGRYLIVGGYENSALVWELPGGRLRWTLPGYDPGGDAGTPSGVAPKIARPLLHSEVGLEGNVLLIPSVKNVSDIPSSGKNLLVVADVDNVLHLRTFDRSSGRAWDGDEIQGDRSYPHTAQQIKDLRRHLVGLWPPHRLTESEKERIIAAVASIYRGQYSDTPPVAHLQFSPGNKYLDRSSGNRGGVSRIGWPPADPPAYDDGVMPNGYVERDTIIAYSPPHGAWGLSYDASQSGLRLFHAAAWNGGRPVDDTRTASPVVDLRKVFPVIIDQGIEAVALGTDQLAIAGDAGRVAAIRIDVNKGSILARTDPKAQKGGQVRCLTFSPGDGQYLVACGGRNVSIWSNIFAPPGNRLFESALRPHNAVVADNRRWRLGGVAADPQRGRFQVIIEIYDRVSGLFRPWTMTPIGSGPVRVQFEEVNPPRRIVTPFTFTTAVALSEDATRLAVTNTERINGWHDWYNTKLDKTKMWQTSDELIPIEDPAGLPPGARIEPPDGHNIWVLDGISGKSLHVLAVPHAEKTTALAFDEEGKALLSFSRDNQIRLWDVDSGKLVRVFNVTDNSVDRLAFSPNGRWIAGVSRRPRSRAEERDKGVVSLWETATGRIVEQFEVGMNPGTNYVWAFHGNLVAVPVSGRRLKVWDLEKGRLALEMNNRGRTIDDVAFVAGGKRLVSDGDGKMTLWTLETESEICSFPLPPNGKGQWPIIVDVLEWLGNLRKPNSPEMDARGTLRPKTSPAGERVRAKEDAAGLVADRAGAEKQVGSLANTAATTRGPVASRFENGNSEGWYTLNEDYTRGATSTPRVDSALFPQGRNSWLVADDSLQTKEFGWHAPREYHGDHSDKFGKFLHYSIWTTGSEAAWSDCYVRLRGAGKIVYVNGTKLSPPVASVWKTYSIKLDSSGGWWVFRGRSGDGPATDQDLKEVLADVTDLRIKGDFGPGPNTGCLDNVEFGAEPEASAN
jgi:WD40 repeat protein